MTAIPNLVTIDLDAPANATGVVDSMLEALDRTQTPATFFVPGTFAAANPESARRIAERGHELACLTMTKPATSKPYCASFTSELEATRDAIENATGRRVRGHRNASFAIDYESEWTYDVLVDRGFEYDSSRIPPKHTEFNYYPVPRTAHAVRRWGGTLLEVPVTTTDVLAMRVRLGTAGTIRGIPLPVWSAVVRGCQTRGEPLVLHLRASELGRRTPERVGRIVSRFSFTSVANALPDLLRTAPIIEA